MWMVSKIRDFSVDPGTGTLYGGTPLLMGGPGAKIKTPTNSHSVRGIRDDDDNDNHLNPRSALVSTSQTSSTSGRIGPSPTGSIFSNYVSNVHGVFGGASYTIDPAAYTTCIRQSLNEKFLKRFLKWVDWAHVKNVATRLMNKVRETRFVTKVCIKRSSSKSIFSYSFRFFLIFIHLIPFRAASTVRNSIERYPEPTTLSHGTRRSWISAIH